MEPDTLMKLCIYLMGNLLKKAEFKEYDLSGIGISFPGFVTSSQGCVTSENFPPLAKHPHSKNVPKTL
jgi:hypothetical protein